MKTILETLTKENAEMRVYAESFSTILNDVRTLLN